MVFLNPKQRRKWLGLISFSVAIVAVSWFLYYEDFSNAWIVLIGAAYLYLDRYDDTEKETE